MLLMSTRLEQIHPDVAAWLQELPRERQSALVQQLAVDAARVTGLSVPPHGTDLVEWSAAVDSRGWSQDSEGEWRQDPSDFARARAASALRDAFHADAQAAAEDSLYESIAALGLDAVRRELGLGT